MVNSNLLTSVNSAEKQGGASREEDIIGRGSYGIIYRWTDPSDGIVKAKKINKSPSEERKILEELTLYHCLDNPFIIKYYGHINDRSFLMELASGGSLDALIKSTKANTGTYINSDDIIKYFLQIVKGLECMHDNMFIHRDIKPDNILLHEDPIRGMIVKITDFGLAFNCIDTQHENETYFGTSCCAAGNGEISQKIGTPYYQAPELICSGNNKCIKENILKVDKEIKIPLNYYNCSIDIWSLGCVLYELCSLRRPFISPKVSLFELQTNILKNPTPKLVRSSMSSSVNSNNPIYMENYVNILIDKMLSKNQKMRPSSKQLANEELYNTLVHCMYREKLYCSACTCASIVSISNKISINFFLQSSAEQ